MDAAVIEGAEAEPTADLWDLIARHVRLERIELRTWWCVAIGSTETDLGTVHLGEDRSLTCGWTPQGSALLGDREPAVRRRLVGVIDNLFEEARRAEPR